MRYIRKRRIRLRLRRSVQKRQGIRRIIPWVLGAVVLWTVISEWGLSSISEELTEEAARGYLLSCIHQAVDEELKNGEGSYVSANKSGNGKIFGFTADAEKINQLKSRVLEKLDKKLCGKATAWIPIGSLFGVGVFNGCGPQVPVKLKLEGSADVSFHTAFVSAGINQSCYRLTMTVTARAYSQSKRFQVQVKESSEAVLSETVVVGDVPQVTLSEGA